MDSPETLITLLFLLFYLPNLLKEQNLTKPFITQPIIQIWSLIFKVGVETQHILRIQQQFLNPSPGFSPFEVCKLLDHLHLVL